MGLSKLLLHWKPNRLVEPDSGDDARALTHTLALEHDSRWDIPITPMHSTARASALVWRTDAKHWM